MLVLALLAACSGKTAPPDTGTSTTIEEVDCSELGVEVPAARGELEGVWDPVGQRMVLFGGNLAPAENCQSANDQGDDVWAYYPDCGAFELLVEGDAGGPAPRSRHALAYDAARRRVLVFGGRYRDDDAGSSTYTLYDDLWALDLDSRTWEQLSDGEGPSARVSHVMAVAGDTLYLYGGNASTSGLSYIALGDLWAYDLAGGTWTELQAAADPGDRLFHADAMAADGSTWYIYGGGDEQAFIGPFFDDLWALDLASLTWTELDAGGAGAPDGRLGANLVVDDARDRLVLWAGHDDQALGNTNQVWSYDLGGGGWSEVHQGDTIDNGDVGFCDFPADFVDPDLAAPERRYTGAAAATGDGRMVVFGGKTDCGVINDGWTYDLATDTWTEGSPATTGEICLRSFAECSSLCF